MGNVAEQFVEPTYPNPPRYWWTKRIPIIALVILVILGGLWFAWSRAARLRVEVEVAAIRARGEALSAEDFSVPAIPDPENAAITLSSAAAASTTMPAADMNFAITVSSQLQTGSPIDAATLQRLDKLASTAMNARALARLARYQGKAVWTTNPILSPPRFANQSGLARLLAIVAISEHLHGRDAEAIEIIRDMLWHADSFEQPNQELIMHLLSMVAAQITNQTLAQLTADLQILPIAGATTQPSGPASREQVQSLIATLMNDDAFALGLARSFNTERAFRYAILASPPTASIQPSLPIVQRSALAWPWVELETLRVMNILDASGKAAAAKDFQSAQAAAARIDSGMPRQSGLTTLVHQVSSQLQMKFTARIDPQFKVLVSRRAMAIWPAIRLFQSDHAGRYPARIDELVPQYLPRIPIDPYAAGNKPFRYLASPNPLVYSVGPDGVDNGGNAMDEVFNLIKLRLAPATTTSSPPSPPAPARSPAAPGG